MSKVSDLLFKEMIKVKRQQKQIHRVLVYYVSVATYISDPEVKNGLLVGRGAEPPKVLDPEKAVGYRIDLKYEPDEIFCADKGLDERMD